jgi:long-chain acyl-CoA synthetase
VKAVADTLNKILAIDPEAPALEFEKSWLTWGDLAAAKAALEALLAPYSAGARIGVMMRNRPATVPPVIACVTTERCLVTMNPVNPDERLIEDLRSLSVPVVIAAGRDWERPGVLEAASESGALCIRVDDDLAVTVLAPLDKPLKSFERAVSPGIAVEMLTSGTTGKPKRIPFRSDAMERAVLAALNFETGRKEGAEPTLRQGVQLLTGPVSHIGGLLALLNALLAGRRGCLLERFTVETFHDAVKRHRPKVAGAPPAALKMLLDAKLPPEDFSSLSAFRTGTAPLDPDLADDIYETFGVPVLQNYGATEFGGVAGWTLADFRAHYPEKRGAVGRLNTGIEGRTIDPDSELPLGPGEKGILELKGKQIGDGQSWVRTTDVAIVDRDRFLFILGRSDNVIIRGGFKVHPDQVVAAMEQHEAIREAAVVGLPDPRLGQAPAAAYVLRSGAADPGGETLSRFLKERLLPYQVPTRFLCLAELPRTTSMKVSQAELRDLFAAQTSA